MDTDRTNFRGEPVRTTAKSWSGGVLEGGCDNGDAAGLEGGVGGWDEGTAESGFDAWSSGGPQNFLTFL